MSPRYYISTAIFIGGLTFAISYWKNKQTGSFGTGCFSFFPTKNITTTEGGMLTTNDKNKYKEVKKLIAHGINKDKKKQFWHRVADLPGHNFRLTNVQAAIGYAQLKRFSKIISERKRVYKYYKRIFKNEEGLKPQLFLTEIKPVVWTFALLLDPKIFINRDKIIQKMKEKGVETRNGFYSPCRLPLYHRYKTSHLKNSNNLSKNVICMPFFAGLKNKQINYIYKEFIKLKKK